MTWEILLGIIAMVGFVGSVATWISKLAKTLGILENTIKVLNEPIAEFKQNSHSTHEKIFVRLTENEKILENHESRIQRLERKN